MLKVEMTLKADHNTKFYNRDLKSSVMRGLEDWLSCFAGQHELRCWLLRNGQMTTSWLNNLIVCAHLSEWSSLNRNYLITRCLHKTNSKWAMVLEMYTSAITHFKIIFIIWGMCVYYLKAVDLPWKPKFVRWAFGLAVKMPIYYLSVLALLWSPASWECSLGGSHDGSGGCIPTTHVVRHGLSFELPVLAWPRCGNWNKT